MISPYSNGQVSLVILPLVISWVRSRLKVKPDESEPRLYFQAAGGGWQLANYGGCPAEELRFSELGYNDASNNHHFNHDPFIAPNLNDESYLTLSGKNVPYNPPVLFTAHVLAATYKDTKGKTYLTYCRSDTPRLFKKVTLWGWKGGGRISRKVLDKIYRHLQKNLQRRNDWIIIKD